MLGAAAGLAAFGKIPFVATFAAFFTRDYDFIRMAAINQSNIKLVGTHIGVNIEEDGPSQMGLEDITMMSAQSGVVVLYPSDATCAIDWSKPRSLTKGWCTCAPADQNHRSSTDQRTAFRSGDPKFFVRVPQTSSRSCSGRDSLRSTQGLRSAQDGGNFHKGDRLVQHRADRPYDRARQCPIHPGPHPHHGRSLRPWRAGRRSPQCDRNGRHESPYTCGSDHSSQREAGRTRGSLRDRSTIDCRNGQTNHQVNRPALSFLRDWIAFRS